MLWMVHRAHLNDPTLTVLDFTNANMPLPHVEPRIAPKLMKAMATNTNMTTLLLSNANLRKPQGAQLTESLKANKTLEVLNIESNFLDSDKIKHMAEALTMNKESKINTWRFDNQRDIGTYFGRPVEEALATLVQTNKSIVKLGFRCQDMHWMNVISKATMTNIDALRRQRKGIMGEEKKDGAEGGRRKSLEVAAVEKPLARVKLEIKPPTKAAWEIFDDDNGEVALVRLFIADRKAMPTKDQLQKFTSSQYNKALKYKVIAPLIRDCRQKLLDAFVNREVTLLENASPFSGSLRSWTEKNDRFSFDLWTKGGGRFNFTTQAQLIIDVSDELADWIRPEEKRFAPDGQAYTMNEFMGYFGFEEGNSAWSAAPPIWRDA